MTSDDQVLRTTAGDLILEEYNLRLDGHAWIDRNLAPGGEVLLSDPFRATSLSLLEAMEAEGWVVTMNKWTVGVTPPPRPVGVFSLRRG